MGFRVHLHMKSSMRKVEKAMRIKPVTLLYIHKVYVLIVKYNLVGESHSADKAIALLTKDTVDLI